MIRIRSSWISGVSGVQGGGSSGVQEGGQEFMSSGGRIRSFEDRSFQEFRHSSEESSALKNSKLCAKK